MLYIYVCIPSIESPTEVLEIRTVSEIKNKSGPSMQNLILVTVYYYSFSIRSR